MRPVFLSNSHENLAVSLKLKTQAIHNATCKHHVMSGKSLFLLSVCCATVFRSRAICLVSEATVSMLSSCLEATASHAEHTKMCTAQALNEKPWRNLEDELVAKEGVRNT